MLSAYLRDGRPKQERQRRESGGERERETSSLVAALLPYYDGILSPRGSGVPDWPDEKVASSHRKLGFTLLLGCGGRDRKNTH